MKRKPSPTPIVSRSARKQDEHNLVALTASGQPFAELLDGIIDSLSKYSKTDVITVGTLIYIFSQEAERVRTK